MLESFPLKSPADEESADTPCQSAPNLRSLFESEETNLLRYAFSLTGRRAVAEEIVQEVFLQLYPRWDQIEEPRAWLYRSIRNRSLDHLRKSKREVPHGESHPESCEMVSPDAAPDTLVERMESCAALRGLIELLPETDRILIRMKYFEGLKYREISEQTGLSIGNVGYRLHHIIHHLASGLKPLGIDDVT